MRIQLGKHVVAGNVERLIREAWTTVTSVGADGRRLELGGTHKQAVFTRPDPDPEKRKVRVLHPSLGLGDLPSRRIRPVVPDDLLEPPDGFTAAEVRADADARARVIFRRPCFTGEWYRCSARRYAGRPARIS